MQVYVIFKATARVTSLTQKQGRRSNVMHPDLYAISCLLELLPHFTALTSRSVQIAAMPIFRASRRLACLSSPRLDPMSNTSKHE